MPSARPPDPAPPVLSRRALLLWPLAFVAILWAAHTLVLGAYRYVDFDCPPHWPLSIYNPRGPHTLYEYGAIVGTIVVGTFTLWRTRRTGYRPAEVAVLGLLLILLTNAVQGVPKGFSNPIAGGISGEQYYHDALRVTDAAEFLRNFHTLQPDLRTHARTHPPGAVLLFYVLHRVCGLPPAAIAIVLAVFATLLSAWAFPRFARTLLPIDAPLTGYGTLLLLLLPAVQIYYCATLDAVIAALLLAAAAFFLRAGTARATLGAALSLTLASFLTFGFAWAIPVLLALDLSRSSWRTALSRLALVLLTLVLFYGILRVAFGFDYLLALRTASHLENPMGFRLIAEPVSYAFTRLEDSSEMIVFLGPFLLALLMGGLPRLARAPELRTARLAFFTATGTLLALFLSGAYHTGETARACVFLYPYLLLPILAVLRSASASERTLFAALTLAQTLGMQMGGNFFW